jgi:hypothetical protein
MVLAPKCRLESTSHAAADETMSEPINRPAQMLNMLQVYAAIGGCSSWTIIWKLGYDWRTQVTGGGG